MGKEKVVIVLPAYNAQKTLQRTLDDIPKSSYDEIILVDDSSKDNTVSLAKELGLKVIEHDKNKGYGGNQKTCYKAALEAGADIVVMLHPDYQYDPRIVPFLTGLISLGICDIMMANRIRTRKEALSGGMPAYKYFANRFLTMLGNLTLGYNLGEFHSGYRAFSRKVLETVNFELNSDNYIFDQEFLMQAIVAGFKMGDIPVAAKYFDEASSPNFKRSLRYGLGCVNVLLKCVLYKLHIVKFKMFKSKNPKTIK